MNTRFENALKSVNTTFSNVLFPNIGLWFVMIWLTGDSMRAVHLVNIDFPKWNTITTSIIFAYFVWITAIGITSIITGILSFVFNQNICLDHCQRNNTKELSIPTCTMYDIWIIFKNYVRPRSIWVFVYIIMYGMVVNMLATLLPNTSNILFSIVCVIAYLSIVAIGSTIFVLITQSSDKFKN